MKARLVGNGLVGGLRRLIPYDGGLPLRVVRFEPQLALTQAVVVQLRRVIVENGVEHDRRDGANGAAEVITGKEIHPGLIHSCVRWIRVVVLAGAGVTVVIIHLTAVPRGEQVEITIVKGRVGGRAAVPRHPPKAEPTTAGWKDSAAGRTVYLVLGREIDKVRVPR